MPLKPAFARDVELGAGEVRIVFDDQDDAVAVVDVVSVVTHVARQQQGRIELRRLCSRMAPTVSFRFAREHDRLVDLRLDGRVLDGAEGGRQEEGERAALAERACDVDLAAEQARDLRG